MLNLQTFWINKQTVNHGFYLLILILIPELFKGDGNYPEKNYDIRGI